MHKFDLRDSFSLDEMLHFAWLPSSLDELLPLRLL